LESSLQGLHSSTKKPAYGIHVETQSNVFADSKPPIGENEFVSKRKTEIFSEVLNRSIKSLTVISLLKCTVGDF